MLQSNGDLQIIKYELIFAYIHHNIAFCSQKLLYIGGDDIL